MTGDLDQRRAATPEPAAQALPSAPRRRLPTLELLAIGLVAAVLLRPRLASVVDNDALQTWSTIFVSITMQALPFLVLGILISGAIAAFVPAAAIARLLPRRSLLAIPAAGLAGAALPGCECGSVPIAGRLTARGASPAAAFAFMLSAPAINPIVLVATAVAFPGRPDIVAARFSASLLAAVVVGYVWARYGDPDLVRHAGGHDETSNRWSMFSQVAAHDFLHAGGWLVLGGMAAATLQVIVPRSILDVVAGNEVIAILALATLAVVLAICSEADAFVATGLSQFSFTSRLVFLVVGPAVDIKLIALQAGVFGRRFAMRFAP
ncbi:MAG TPA: permease, partial [Euzebya sp.]|nr:permease [Euzebya sp.]